MRGLFAVAVLAMAVPILRDVGIWLIAHNLVIPSAVGLAVVMALLVTSSQRVNRWSR